MVDLELPSKDLKEFGPSGPVWTAIPESFRLYFYEKQVLWM